MYTKFGAAMLSSLIIVAASALPTPTTSSTPSTLQQRAQVLQRRPERLAVRLLADRHVLLEH